MDSSPGDVGREDSHNEVSDTSSKAWEMEILERELSPSKTQAPPPVSPNRELPVAYHSRMNEVDLALQSAKAPKRKLVFDRDSSITSSLSISKEIEKEDLDDEEASSHLIEEGAQVEGIEMKEGRIETREEIKERDIDERDVTSSPSKVLHEMHEIQAHLWSHHQLEDKLKTNLQQGITQQEVLARQERDGKNVLSIKHGRHPLLTFVIVLFEGFGPILWGSMILCFVAYIVAKGTPGDAYNLALGILLFVVIIAQGLLGYYQGHKSSKLMEVLKQVLPSQCIVCREGLETSIDAIELVVGDIVTIHSGYKIPADIRVLQCKEAKVDNSLLTGESEPQHLKEHSTNNNPFETHNLAFYGTMVVEGQFKGVVIATAQNTLTGRLVSQMSHAKPAKAPLQSEINKFALQIVIMALTIGVVIVATWAGWLNRTYKGFLTPAALLVTIVSVMVACLPDGMPLAVQTTMMLVAKRMLKVNVLVKSLPIIETLGSTTAILTDKTGTLTENKMTVSSLWMDGKVVPVMDEITLNSLIATISDNAVFSAILNICALCNRATQDSTGAIIGDASETGLLNFHMRTDTMGSESVHTVQLRNPKLAEIPFNSKNKWQASIHKSSSTGHEILLVKGAPEKVLKMCDKILLSDGQIVDLAKDTLQAIEASVIMLGSKGQRVLGTCQKALSSSGADARYSEEDINGNMNNMCFVGLVAMHDPIRASVPPALAQCARAHVQVIMVTGDHPATAEAIARQAGIFSNDDESGNNEDKKDKSKSSSVNRIIQGQEIHLLTDEEWEKIFHMSSNVVFARTTPQDKLKIVQEAQRCGHSVTMLGDGVNDAPALKAANVGVAMGNGGSDVAREAAGMLLMDNNFSSLIQGIKSGRLLFENMKKVVIYLLPAGSFSEIIPVFGNVFLGLPLPLSAFQMIVICLFSDVLPSLSLVYERPEQDIMNKKPRNLKTEKLVNWQLIFNAYFYIGVYESFVGFLNYFLVMGYYGVYMGDLFFAFNKWGGDQDFHGLSPDTQTEALNAAQTAFFVGLTFMQFFNVVVGRTRRMSIFKQGFNPYMVIAILVDLALILFICLVPAVNGVFGTNPIPWYCWLIPFPCGFLYLGADEFRKYHIRRNPDGRLAKFAW